MNGQKQAKGREGGWVKMVDERGRRNGGGVCGVRRRQRVKGRKE